MWTSGRLVLGQMEGTLRRVSLSFGAMGLHELLNPAWFPCWCPNGFPVSHFARILKGEAMEQRQGGAMGYIAHQIAFDEILEGFVKLRYPRGYVVVIPRPQEYQEELRRLFLVGGSGVLRDQLLVLAFESRQEVVDMLTLFQKEHMWGEYSLFKDGLLLRGLPPEE